MKKPVLRYDSRGPEGNVFWIIGQAQRLMKQNGRIAESKALWERVQNAGSYKEALDIIGEEVTLIDTAN